MPPKPVPFATLHRLLHHLGFVQTPVEGTHVVFEHKKSGTLVLFRPHGAEEQVDRMTLAALRRTLDENGFVERDDSEEMLRRFASPEAGKRRK
jgi:predicted RNA binding protein YcfA (HicA-like mRNA interferase family)